MGVAEASAAVANRLGLHARPAGEFVKLANKFTSHIQVAKDSQWVNAKSILGVMTLAAEQGSILTIRAEGDDAEEAVEVLTRCVQKVWGDLDG